MYRREGGWHNLRLGQRFAPHGSWEPEKKDLKVSTPCFLHTSQLNLVPLSSVPFSRSVMSDSLRPHESQHARPPCPSPTPEVHSNSCPSSQWCHSAISSSVVPFSSCPQSLPASGSFPVSQFFTSGGQRIGVSASASVLPMNSQDGFPLTFMSWYKWTYLQNRKRLTDTESKFMITKGGRDKLGVWD